MKRYKYTTLVIAAALIASSCKKTLDINESPNNPTNVPIAQLYTGAAVNIGFTGGSDLNRYSELIMQQYSGQTTGSSTQTQDAEKYLIQGSDLNNLWGTLYSTTLVNLDIVIQKADESKSPHYAGIAKLLKAYTYGIMVDTWGKIPFSEALKLTENIKPVYDDDATIYNSLLTLIDAGIADINQGSSTFEPISDSPIFPGDFADTKTQWVKFGNTLKLRLLLHMANKDASAVAKLNALIGSGTFMSSIEDDFSANFLPSAGAQNPIYQFDVQRAGYLVANKTIVDLMNTKVDPRRPKFFTDYPVGSGLYVGSVGGAEPSQKYSKLGTYLKGNTGDAPIRMLTFAEYNFIRAEAALTLGSPGNAQTFYQAGITASMNDAGVSQANITTYLAAHGTLTGSTAEQLKQIIEEKYVANFGVTLEPWSDWRRTGYPNITPPANALFKFVPRSLLYPQSEIDLNPNARQKNDMSVKVFWDK
jgi:hypothetical protein